MPEQTVSEKLPASVLVEDKRKKLADQLHQDLTGAQYSHYLKASGLPDNYDRLTAKSQRQARLSVLQGWYDTRRPQQLITDYECFYKAFFLWVEYYYKPLYPYIYYFRDHALKHSVMIRGVFSPPLIETEASKAIVSSTRQVIKTQTLVKEMMPFLCICRPHTRCVLAEFNQKRTREEMQDMKEIVEENERIHADFGGEGELFPAPRDPQTWSVDKLSFAHSPRTSITGTSIGAANRGRGAIYIVIDDPETDEKAANPEWRRKFFRLLLDVWFPMLMQGAVFVWPGTIIREDSCLAQASRGMVEKEEAGGVSVSQPDERFRDVKKIHIPVISRTPEGGYVSHQPDRMSVEAFLHKLDLDPISARKEILGEAVTPGTRLFPYHAVDHSFMECEDGDGHYMLDCLTGRRKPWKQFVEELKVMGAGDQAGGGQSADADPSALVVEGVDPSGTLFVLDAWQSITFPEHMVDEALLMADRWFCTDWGWEQIGLLIVINRIVKEKFDQRTREGHRVPIFHGLENIRQRKVSRLSSTRHLWVDRKIRFRRFDDFQQHKHVPYTNILSYRSLMAQLREYTEHGLYGHDDLADAYEMVTRMVTPYRGQLVDQTQRHPTDVIVEEAKKAGYNIQEDYIPAHLASPRMLQRKERTRRLSGALPWV